VEKCHNLKGSLPEKIGNEIKELWEEYEYSKSKEALFVKALDKIEAYCHMIETAGDFSKVDERDPHVVAVYPDKDVKNFPELKLVLKELKKRMKIEFEKRGIEWKPEYDSYEEEVEDVGKSDKVIGTLKPGKDFIGFGCGSLVVNDKDEVLLLKRSMNSRTSPGMWSQPGGGVEYGERVEEAIEREIFEETNLIVKVTEFLDFTQEIGENKEHHWIPVSYLSKYVSGEIIIKEPHKHDEIKWFSLDNLPDNVNFYTKRTIDAYLSKKKQGRMIEEIQELIMQQALQKGFGVKPEDVNVAEKMALIHSEISEAFEAYRHKNIDGKDGFKEELGDVVHRVLHLCGIFDIDIEKEIMRKLEYNKSREWNRENMNERFV